MRSVLPEEPVRIGLGLILVLVCAGCATTEDITKLKEGLTEDITKLQVGLTEDITKLKEGLTQELKALKTSAQTQVTDLRKELETVQETQQKQHQDLAKTLDAEFKEAKRNADTRTRMIEALKSETAKTKEELIHWLPSLKELPFYLTQIQKGMNEIRETFLGSLEIEEAALEARLAALKESREKLKGVVTGRLPPGGGG